MDAGQRRPANAGSAEAQTPRCLIVVAEPLLAQFVHLSLDHGQYDRRLATTVTAAKSAVRQWQPHLAIVDLGLEEGADPVELIGLHEPARIPVIALSHSANMRAKLAAFERGVDDLLTVPFRPEELIARSIALMLRVHRIRVPFRPTMAIGKLQIDLMEERVSVEGQVIKLTATQRALLYVLAAGGDGVLSRDQLLEYIYGDDALLIESNVIDRHIRDLRSKLGDNTGHPRYIETVAGEGYRFVGAPNFLQATS